VLRATLENIVEEKFKVGLSRRAEYGAIIFILRDEFTLTPPSFLLVLLKVCVGVSLSACEFDASRR